MSVEIRTGLSQRESQVLVRTCLETLCTKQAIPIVLDLGRIKVACTGSADHVIMVLFGDAILGLTSLARTQIISTPFKWRQK